MIHIVGKGPSLAYLRAEHFADGPVIALNESILHVLKLNLPNKLFSMQKDGCQDIRDRMEGKCNGCTDGPIAPMVPVPPDVTLILHEEESSNCFPGHPRKVIYSAQEWFGFALTPSAPCAGRLVKLMGADSVRLLCFDALKGDDRTMEPWGIESYGHTSYIPADTRMLEELEGIPYELVFPDRGDLDV